MKVTFKLTREQAIRAQAIVHKTAFVLKKELDNTEPGDKPYFFGSGNMLVVCDHYNVNKSQMLDYNPAKGTVTFEGHRHALVTDGAMVNLSEAAGGDLTALNVVECVTTDKRLQWFETLQDYLNGSKATLKDVEAYFASGKVQFLKMNAVRFCNEQVIDAIKAGKSPAVLAASFTSGELSLARRVMKVIA